MSKFKELSTQNTNGANYDIDTDQIIAKLSDWDEKYGVEISDVGHDKVTVRFSSLPDNLESLAKEVYEFCPDTIDQGHGCYDEMIEAAEEMDREIPQHIQELVEGVDLSNESYGLVLLEKALKKHRVVALWWD